MSDKPKAPYRDPKYSGWPGPEPVQVEVAEITPHGEPYQPPESKPKRKRAETSATGAGAGE
jgi:hypothetical protein